MTKINSLVMSVFYDVTSCDVTCKLEGPHIFPFTQGPTNPRTDPVLYGNTGIIAQQNERMAVMVIFRIC